MRTLTWERAGWFLGIHWCAVLWIKTDGNYWVIFSALPTAFHEDERYYAKGEGEMLKRAYCCSLAESCITPNLPGTQHVEGIASEIVGQGHLPRHFVVLLSSADRNIGDLSQEVWLSRIRRDALTNVFREFWPDVLRTFGIGNIRSTRDRACGESLAPSYANFDGAFR